MTQTGSGGGSQSYDGDRSLQVVWRVIKKQLLKQNIVGQLTVINN